jgi:hypothetical protein
MDRLTAPEQRNERPLFSSLSADHRDIKEFLDGDYSLFVVKEDGIS